MKRRLLIGLVVCAALFCAYIFFLDWRDRQPAPPVVRVFPATGVKTVVLRASEALTAKVSYDATNQIQISGLPAGGAQGYHSPDPFWRPTLAKDWGMNFVTKSYGSILVISTEKEIGYIHHQYLLDKLSLHVPQGIKVVKEEKQRTGEPDPDLKKPSLIHGSKPQQQ